MADFDGIVDSLSSTPTETPGSRMRRGAATTARGDSPAVDSHPDYHLDQPVDRRVPFAKSAADDGGLSVLDSPNERGPSTREALLAADQSDVQGVMTMKPRSVEVQRGSGRAKRGSGAVMASGEVGLAMQPIRIQRQADVDDMGQAVDQDGFKPRTFLSDGTVAGGRRINETKSITVEESSRSADVEVSAVPVGKPADVKAALPAAGGAAQLVSRGSSRNRVTSSPEPAGMSLNPQRVVFQPPGGGKIRTNVDHVVISDSIILIMYDIDAETTYEPPAADSSSPIKITIEDTTYSCIYNDFSAEDANMLYLVLIRLPGAVAS